MMRMSSVPLLLLLINLVSLSMAFTIDDINTKNFTVKARDTGYFGYQALQFKHEKEKWIIASAPMLNGSGGVYKCSPKDGNCDLFLMEERDSTKSTGIALAIKSTSSAQITTCSPSLAHECDSNSYLNGICYRFSSELKLVDNITTAFQDCTKRKVDLVFLFDGSESLQADDFAKNKEFISEIMKMLSNTSIQFAAAQFSDSTRTVFTFKEYQTKEAQKLLEKEAHMKELTNTFGGIYYVLENILNNTKNGAIPDATKVLVIITDGNSTDIDWRNTVKALDDKHITRYIIGVDQVDMEKLNHLASEPKKKNTFYINNYSGLKGILHNLQNKIYNIEGTQNALSRKFKHEMSQSGFSAVYLEDTLILGSVGSNTWRGSLIEVGPGTNYSEIGDPQMEEDSYMGYSVAVGRKANKSLYFSGAPRFQHTGQVLLFHKEGGRWVVIERKNGEQIGEYFGGVLCAVDIDSDDETDFLLVGAPLYQNDFLREGRLFVYNLTTELVMWEKQRVIGPSQGRFASSISSLKDLNGDGLRDVAVGAPLEDDQKGAVYIYLGDRLRGIRSDSSQRITARTAPSLQFFGQSIDGQMDLGEDGLTDIIVGARGQVILFRSRPVLNVSAQLSFSESQISTDRFQCLDTEKNFSVGELKVCFMVKNVLLNIAESVKLGLTLSYQLDLDSVRQKSRAFLNHMEKGSRRNDSSLELSLGETCLNYSIYMLNCVKDTLSPIMIKLNFSQSEDPQDNYTAVLNTDSNTVALMEVPFQNCQGKEKCVSQLELDFNFTTPTLLVVDQDYFRVTGKLSNRGDDSYNTSITFYYPPGLSFSKMNVLKATRRTLTSCFGLEDKINQTICNVSLPVYHSKTFASFSCSFLISNMYDWGDSMEMVITAHSDNGNSTTSRASLPVQFAVDLAVKAHDGDSVTYLSLEGTEPKTMKHIFEVKNLGYRSLPVTATFTFPTQIQHNFVMKDHSISVLENQAQCGNITDGKTQNCSKEQCKEITCDFHLNHQSSVWFTLSGEVSFFNKTFLPRTTFSSYTLEVQFSSWMKLSYDKVRFVQTASTPEDQADPTKFPQAKIDSQVELIIPPNKALIIGLGAGGGFLVLLIIFVILWKWGFFKRKTPQCDEQMPPPDLANELPENENEEDPKLNTSDNEKKEVPAQDPSSGAEAEGSDT